MKNEIKKIISEILSIKSNKISLDSSLVDLGADSLDRISVIMALEDFFNVHIDNEKIKNIHTVGEIYDHIKERKRKSEHV